MRKQKYSKELVNVVERFLKEDEWRYSFNENSGVFEFSLRTKGRIQRIDYVINVHENEITVYGICPIGADYDNKEMMAEMAEFLCRANYGLKNGCFEFDFRDGEIRFKSFIDCDESVPPMKVIMNSVYLTSAMYKRYAPGITDIIFVGCTAKEAIKRCEQFRAEELRLLLGEALGESTNGSDAGDMRSCLDDHQGSTKNNEDSEETFEEDNEDDLSLVEVSDVV